jgi:hypothetical protein
LESGIGNFDHRGDDVGIAFPSQVGDAVFGDDNIAEVSGNGGMSVVPDDIGFDLTA